MESLECGLPLCVFLFPAVSPMREATKDLPRAKRQYFSGSRYRFHIRLKLWHCEAAAEHANPAHRRDRCQPVGHSPRPS
jgi:hypothetical protein